MRVQPSPSFGFWFDAMLFSLDESHAFSDPFAGPDAEILRADGIGPQNDSKFCIPSAGSLSRLRKKSPDALVFLVFLSGA